LRGTEFGIEWIGVNECPFAPGTRETVGRFFWQASEIAVSVDGLEFPLRLDSGGVVRVGDGRVSLDLVVKQYENGMTPEELVSAYDTLLLADVYSAIAYYLRHRDAVWAYLKRRGQDAEALRAEIEAERPRVGPEELAKRRSARGKDHAAAGQ
jgi:uncharacterized protein (DUF433 family)